MSRSRIAMLLLALVLPTLAAACVRNVVDTRDDLTTTTRVKTALLNDPAIGGMRIDVETVKGVVTLSGTVTTAADADKAAAIARKVAGVSDVRSDLKIQP